MPTKGIIDSRLLQDLVKAEKAHETRCAPSPLSPVTRPGSRSGADPAAVAASAHGPRTRRSPTTHSTPGPSPIRATHPTSRCAPSHRTQPRWC